MHRFVIRSRRARLVAATLSMTAVAAAGVALDRTAEARTAPVSPAVVTAEYNLGDKVFTDKEDWPHGFSEMRAVVRYPRHLPAGRMPVVVLLHGQQYSCYSAREEDWGWPCPAGVKPYPSHRGYDYLGDALARDGFLVLSLSANGINNYMGVAPQRAKLIYDHLGLWRQLTASGGGPLAGRFTDPATGQKADVDLRGRVDLTRVGLMGHSVGGEGVMVAAADEYQGKVPSGVRVRGVVSVASPGSSGFYPTLVTRMPFAVISADCWSARDHEYFTDARGKTRQPAYLVRVARANHNYFNTAWTSGPGESGGDDTNCADTPNRPTPRQQQDFAVAYLRAFYGLALNDDRRGVPVLTGARRVPGVDTVISALP
jgi:pimeloyl-ACP methyl ester carboxylesterase